MGEVPLCVQNSGITYRPQIVRNLGEAGQPMAQTDPDARLDCRLALLYNGLWGDFIGPNPASDTADTPEGPVRQKFPIGAGSRQWPDNIYVDFGYSGLELGTSVQPFSHLGDAVAFLAEGGTIIIRAGTSSERLIISKACTITTSGGTATIGQ